jgi:hypothetical protein
MVQVHHGILDKRVGVVVFWLSMLKPDRNLCKRACG